MSTSAPNIFVTMADRLLGTLFPGGPVDWLYAPNLKAQARVRFDLACCDGAALDGQDRRRVVYEALRQGGYSPWNSQRPQRASERYMRNDMALNTLEDSQRSLRGE